MIRHDNGEWSKLFQSLLLLLASTMAMQWRVMKELWKHPCQHNDEWWKMLQCRRSDHSCPHILANKQTQQQWTQIRALVCDSETSLPTSTCQHRFAKWKFKKNIPFRFSLSTWLSSSLIFYQDQWDITNGYIVSNSIRATEASEDRSNMPFPTNMRFNTDLEIPSTAGKDKRNIRYQMVHILYNQQRYLNANTETRKDENIIILLCSRCVPPLVTVWFPPEATMLAHSLHFPVSPPASDMHLVPAFVLDQAVFVQSCWGRSYNSISLQLWHLATRPGSLSPPSHLVSQASKGFTSKNGVWGLCRKGTHKDNWEEAEK